MTPLRIYAAIISFLLVCFVVDAATARLELDAEKRKTSDEFNRAERLGSKLLDCAEDLDRATTERRSCCTTCMDVCVRCADAVEACGGEGYPR